MELIDGLVQYGALGSVAAVSMFQTWVMTKKLFEIVEKITITMAGFTKAMEKCQIIHESK